MNIFLGPVTVHYREVSLYLLIHCIALLPVSTIEWSFTLKSIVIVLKKLLLLWVCELMKQSLRLGNTAKRSPSPPFVAPRSFSLAPARSSSSWLASNCLFSSPISHSLRVSSACSAVISSLRWRWRHTRLSHDDTCRKRGIGRHRNCYALVSTEGQNLRKFEWQKNEINEWQIAMWRCR